MKKIFVHSPSIALEHTAKIPGIEFHPERALHIAQKDDIIILRSMPDAGYLSFLDLFGLGTRNIYVCEKKDFPLSKGILEDDLLLGILKDQKDAVLDTQLISQYEIELSEKTGLPLICDKLSLVQDLNSKFFFKGFVKKLGISQLPYTFGKIGDAKHRPLPIIIKSDISYSGSGIWIIDKEEDLKALPKDSRTYIIEQKEEVAVSPNLQFFIEDEKIEFIALTDQVLKGPKHVGNAFPSQSARQGLITDMGQKIAKEIQLMGYRGCLGIDFIETKSDVFPVELNSRVNGSTYVNLLKARLGRGCFYYTMYKTRALDFKALKNLLGEFLFDGKKGIFPYAVSCLRYGYFFGAIFHDSLKQAYEYDSKVRGILG